MPDAVGFRVLGEKGDAVPRLNTDPIEPGMFALVPPAEPGVRFSLAEVLRVLDGRELRPGELPYFMANIWKVKLAETHENRPNIFGKWSRVKSAKGAGRAWGASAETAPCGSRNH